MPEQTQWDVAALTRAAFYYHPDLAVARAQFNTATGGIATAHARPTPTLQSQPRYTFNPRGGITPWYMQIFSGFIIETAGKRRHRTEQATHLANASQFAVGQAAWLVRSRLRSALVTHLGATLRLDTLKQQVATQQDVVARLTQSAQLGEANGLDVTQAQIALEQLHLQHDEAVRQQQESLAQVAQAIGVPVEAIADISLATDWMYHPEVTDTTSRLDYRREAVQGRPDMHSRLAEFEASHAALQLVISQRYPDIRIGPGYLFNQGQHFAALPLDLVFMNPYSTKGAIKQARARRQEMATRFEALQAQIIGDVDRGYTAYQKAVLKLQAAEGLVAQQDEKQRRVQQQFDVGEVDALALRLAETEQHTARLTYVDTLIQAQQARGLLEDAIQRPLNAVRPALADVNSHSPVTRTLNP
ncbi:MAG: TolC family protein [Cyanobacteria bacterium HKST-UBA03]|nr:TolC family protein [Cyanobacteria bacterium HKST-UBA03]